MQIDLGTIFEKAGVSGRRTLRWELFGGLAEEGKWREFLKSKEIEIDLSGFQIISHDGMLWIGFISLWRRSRNLATYITLPENDSQVGYLKYLGFDQLQEQIGLSFSNEYLFEQTKKVYKPKNEHVVWLSKMRFVSPETWDNVANSTNSHIEEYLADKLALGNVTGEEYYEYIKPFAETICEFIHNVALHGGDIEGRGYGLVSYTPGPPDYPILRFCCTDIGHGFRANLAEHHSLQCRDDAESVTEALLFRYFEKDEGIVGIYPTLKHIRRRSGKIGIRSGNVLAFLDLSKKSTQSRFDSDYGKPTRDWLRRLLSFRQLPFLPGVHIFVDLQLPTAGRHHDRGGSS